MIRRPIDASLAELGSPAYFSRLVNRPEPHRFRKPPELVFDAIVGEVEPVFTVVTPTFAHESTIGDYIASTLNHASLPFDWIIVDDGSEDGTVEKARSAFQSLRHPLVGRTTIIRNPVPIFETACDNEGFALAEADVIIEIQADIQVRESGFDRKFIDALQTSPTPSAVSGRCGHTFSALRARRSMRSFFRGAGPDEFVGLCGKRIETPEIVEALRGRFYRCETVNRGPWVLLKRDLDRVGCLDERFFFLGHDDHDYHRRLFETEGRRPLYVPTSIYSPLHLGAIRRKRTGLNREVYEELQAEKKGSPAFRQFLASQRTPFLPEPIDAT